jgi:type II secretory pathway pseudopilin PulG
MKKSFKTMFGVTLLEIMLVLAIAGIIIAMSVRYYQQAATNQKVTAGMSAVTAVVAAVEQWKLKGLALTSTNLNSNNKTLDPYFPDGMPVSPWTNNPLTYAGTGSAYTVSIDTTDSGACKILAEQLATQPGYTTNPSACGTTATVTVGSTT